MVAQISEKESQSPQVARLGANPDRLNSWKEIARYLKREVRTVQLWEKREGLPVHRHFHNQSGTVFAFRSEIEAWGVRRADERANVQRVPPNLEAAEKAAPVRFRIAIVPAEGESHRSYPSTLLIATARLLDTAKVELLLDTRGQEAPDFVLRWKTVFRADRFIAELFSAGSQTVIWSRTLGTEDGEEPVRLAQEIGQCLWLQLTSTIKFVARATRSPKAGAREAYMKGRYLWSRRNEEDLRKAITWFRAAIWRDPDFALPYTGLADSLTLLSFYEIVSPAEAMPQARDAALRAIELDPGLAEAHTSLADVNLHFDWQWEAAGQGYRRAIECNPGYALGYHWYANLLAATGQHDAAYFAVMQALEIDPASLITQVWAGVTSYLARRFDDAIMHYRNALELDQNFTWAHMYLAQALEQKGHYSEALEAFDTTIRLAGGSNCVSAMKAHAYAAAGDKRSAQEMLGKLRRTPFGKCMPSYDIAATHAALGDSAQALRWLQRACGERNMKLFTLSQDPRFDDLRERTEFREVLQRVNKGDSKAGNTLLTPSY